MSHLCVGVGVLVLSCSGLCTQTFYGHLNSCNAAAFNLLGTQLASTDADGCVKLWDTRMVAEIMTIQTGKHAANKCCYDRSGQVGTHVPQTHTHTHIWARMTTNLADGMHALSSILQPL